MMSWLMVLLATLPALADNKVETLCVNVCPTPLTEGRSADRDKAVSASLSQKNPKNVIFFLGDGMGTQEITAARYSQGVHNKLAVDHLPLTGFDTTWSVKPAAKSPFMPDDDPASAATG